MAISGHGGGQEGALNSNHALVASETRVIHRVPRYRLVAGARFDFSAPSCPPPFAETLTGEVPSSPLPSKNASGSR